MDCETSLLKLKNYSNNDLINYLLTEKNLNHLHSLKIILDDLYYNTSNYTDCNNCFSDEQYDILKDIITTRDPDYIPPVGIRIRENSNEVNLPFFLPSIDKIKQNDDKKLKNWIKKNNDNLPINSSLDKYIITDKLDGVSCLMVIKNNKKKLYTRGDGNKGSDISYIYQYIKNVPKNVKNIVIRGELIISKVNFLKYSEIYSNARNMVSGLINSKSISDGLNDIEFITYEIIENNEQQNIPSSQLELLSNLRFSTSFFTTSLLNLEQTDLSSTGQGAGEDKSVEQASPLLTGSETSSLKEALKEIGIDRSGSDFVTRDVPFFTRVVKPVNLDIGILESYHIERKMSSLYEIDGIVIQYDIPYIRPINTNPKYSFAFKMIQSGYIKKTTVLRVEWNVSKYGVLKPRVEIEPVHIGGVIISYSSAFNAKYVIDNKICVGSVIGITRSGDVIPYIVYVEKNENNLACMPDVKYKWNNSGIDILLDEEDNGEINIKIISGVFSKLNIKYISISTVRKLYINGFDTFLKIISASINQLLEIFQEKTSNRIYKNIKDVLKNSNNGVNLENLLGSICIFGYGIGSKKIKNLLSHIPNLFEIYKIISEEELVSLILSVEGFSNITAKKIIDNILICDNFINDVKPYINFKNDTLQCNTILNELKNKKIVFSGFRDKVLEDNIISNGGKTSLSVSKNTDILVVSDINENTSKKLKALELNIIIISKDDFINRYLDHI